MRPNGHLRDQRARLLAFGIQPGYDDSNVKEEFDPIIQRFRRDDSRVTLDRPQLPTYGMRTRPGRVLCVARMQPRVGESGRPRRPPTCRRARTGRGAFGHQ
jgi:hypothetical protein